MGRSGGTQSLFTRAFRAKRHLHYIFLGKKAIIITSCQTRHNDLFFSHYNLFLGKLMKEAHAPWASHNTP